MQTNISAGLEKGATRKSFYNKHKQASRPGRPGWEKVLGKSTEYLGPKYQPALEYTKRGKTGNHFFCIQHSTAQEGRRAEEVNFRTHMTGWSLQRLEDPV